VWDYGYRSKCCFAPIRLGRKKVKNTNIKINVWVCCKCKAKDVALVEYNKDDPTRSSREFVRESNFITEDDRPEFEPE
jgi:hypothetical protein